MSWADRPAGCAADLRDDSAHARSKWVALHDEAQRHAEFYRENLQQVHEAKRAVSVRDAQLGERDGKLQQAEQRLRRREQVKGNEPTDRD